VDALLYNEDGSKLFTLSSEAGFGDATMDVLSIWDAENGAALARIEEPTGIVSADYAFQRGLIMVATGSGIVNFYEVSTLEIFGTMQDRYTVAENAHVAITPDAAIVVVASCVDESCGSSQLKAYYLLDGSEVGSAILAGSPVLDLAVSPDGSKVAVLSQTGLEIFALPNLIPGGAWENADDFSISDFVINGNGSQALISGCNNAECTEGRVSLLDTTSMSVLGVVPSHTGSASLIVFKPDFSRFISSNLGEIIERSATTGTETQRFDLASGEVSSMVYTPDGLRLAVGTSEGAVVFFDLGQ
jgi:WD40 repeat protein